MRLIIVFLSGLFLLIPYQAHSESRPGLEHYQIAENMAQCSAVQRVYLKFKAKIDSFHGEMRVFQANLLEKREALETCGLQNGLPTILAGQKREEFLAYHCPEAYDDWLSPNYETLTVEEDASNAQASLHQAKSYLEKHCPPLL